MNTTTSAAAPVRIDLEAMAKAINSMSPEPIGQWMRANGFPPEMYRLLLPRSMAAGLLFLPSYVTISSAVEQPMFMLRGLTELVALDFTDVAAAPTPRNHERN